MTGEGINQEWVPRYGSDSTGLNKLGLTGVAKLIECAILSIRDTMKTRYSTLRVADPRGTAMFLLTLWLTTNVSATICGDSLRILMHYHGTQTNTYAGIKIGALGDVNRDGYSDIAISQLGDNPGTNVVLGGNPSDSISDKFIKGLFEGVIDLNGDGTNDVITSLVRVQQTGPPGVLYFFRGFADSLAGNPYDSLIVPAVDGFGIGVPVEVGYCDKDSLGDLLVLDGYRSGGPALRLHLDCPAVDTSTDWEYDVTWYSHDLRGLGFIDFNGDGHQDIFIGMHADLDTISYVYIFLGPAFTNEPNIEIAPPPDITGLSKEDFARYVANVGDVNGDGWNDLAVIFGDQVLLYHCGPKSDEGYDLDLSGRAQTVAEAGDFNGDGFNDLVCGQTRTADGAVDIYLGGPRFDSTYDCSRYRLDLPPVLLQDIGYNVSSAGDFNGDGICDFMFSCRNFAGGLPGDVFVIAGSGDIVTGVNERLDTVPSAHDPTLANYPNPFNGSTRLVFSLDRPSDVELAVYDMLGRRVKVLVSGRRSAGEQTAVWNGRTETGEAASGVYFCRLSVGGRQVSQKMMMVK
ncbi:MAG: T9SS type A sorting domain-containing protein [candidate division Zixibacteria bacterium]|nr:T9SS type A sorting domain-containing protein [candidate division Zixibacteria bacterium]